MWTSSRTWQALILAAAVLLSGCGGGGGGGAASMITTPATFPPNVGTFTTSSATVPGSSAANLVAASPLAQSPMGLNLSSITFQPASGPSILGVIDPARQFGWLAPWPGTSSVQGSASRRRAKTVTPTCPSSYPVSQLNAQSTAVVLLWVNPAIFSSTRACQTLAVLNGLPQVTGSANSLAAALQTAATTSGSTNPFTSPSVVSAYLTAEVAAVAALNTAGIARSTVSGQHFVLGQQANQRRPSATQTCISASSSAATVTALNSNATQVVLSGTTIKPTWCNITAGFGGVGQALSWFGVVYPVNTNCASSAAFLSGSDAFLTTAPGSPADCQSGYVSLLNGGKPSGYTYLPMQYGITQITDLEGNAFTLAAGALQTGYSYVTGTGADAGGIGTDFDPGPNAGLYDVSLYTCADLSTASLASQDKALINSWDQGYQATSLLNLNPGQLASLESCSVAVTSVALDIVSVFTSFSAGTTDSSCVTGQLSGIASVVSTDSSSTKMAIDLAAQVTQIAGCVAVIQAESTGSTVLGGLLTGPIGALVLGVLKGGAVVADAAETADIVYSMTQLQPWEGYLVQVGAIAATPSPTASPTVRPTATPTPTVSVGPTVSPTPTATPTPTPTPSTTPLIVEFPLPAAAIVYGIAAGPDGALWFTDGGSAIGHITTAGSITQYSIPTHLGANGIADQTVGIAAGPDGAMWFTEQGVIGRITTSGSASFYPTNTVNSGPYQITPGPDGAMWFAENGSGMIGRITTAGSITEYAVPTANSSPTGITAGPDGALWFTETSANKIGRITTGGVISEYAIPSPNSEPGGIAVGSDGNLWFAESNAYKIGRITPMGAVVEYPLPSAGHGSPLFICAAPDQNMWFTDTLGRIGRITVAGSITLFTVPAANSLPFAITSGPDHNIWFSDYTNYAIGRLVLK